MVAYAGVGSPDQKVYQSGSATANIAIAAPSDVIDAVINRTLAKSNGKGGGLLEREATREFLRQHLVGVVPQETKFSPDTGVIEISAETYGKLQPYIAFAIQPLALTYKGESPGDERLEQKAIEVMKRHDPTRITVFNYLQLLMQQELAARLSQKGSKPK